MTRLHAINERYCIGRVKVINPVRIFMKFKIAIADGSVEPDGVSEAVAVRS